MLNGKPKFTLGRLLATPGALAALEECRADTAGDHFPTCLRGLGGRISR